MRRAPAAFASFKDASIVEIGFAGSRVRETNRNSLNRGAILDVATGGTVTQ